VEVAVGGYEGEGCGRVLCVTGGCVSYCVLEVGVKEKGNGEMDELLRSSHSGRQGFGLFGAVVVGSWRPF
jgi:hypothetical protein